LQVASDSGEVVDHLDPQCAQVLGGSDPRQHEERAAEAREAASASGAMAVYAAATALVFHADYTRGRIAQAVRLMEEAGEAFDDLSEEALGSYLDAAYYLGWGEYFLERFDHAVHHLERGVAVSRRTGQGRLLVAMMLVLALALVARGRLADALDLAEEGLEASRLTGGPQALSYALRVIAGWR
jgi:tetratricopeptide (TPR) repeat protein